MFLVLYGCASSNNRCSSKTISASMKHSETGLKMTTSTTWSSIAQNHFNPRVYYIWHRRSSRSTSMRINENRLSSMKKMLSYEYCLLLENDLIDKAPSLCAELFFSRIFDILASSHLTGKCSYTTQKPVYETMYEIASSYKQVVNSRLPYPRLELAKRLLLRKRFFFLHVYLSLGTKIKTASA